MAGVTNQLVGYCSEASPLYDAREYDTVVSSGEQVTAGLMAMVLQQTGVPARSWLGAQIPIRTDDMHGKARISGIETEELDRRMASGEVPVVVAEQIHQDIVAYLRSVRLVSTESGSGLYHLMEDMDMIARTRSDGVVSRVLIRGLVFE